MSLDTAPKIDDYRQERTIGNELERGGPRSWDWTKNGGHYFNHRDFFSVHWEIHLPKTPGVLRLHVESPRFEISETLNDLKGEVVESLRATRFRHEVESAGYGFKAGSRVSTEAIKANKCTEVFRVILTPKQRGETHRAEIEQVQQSIGAGIDEVLRRFTPRLRECFEENR